MLDFYQTTWLAAFARSPTCELTGSNERQQGSELERSNKHSTNPRSVSSECYRIVSRLYDDMKVTLSQAGPSKFRSRWRILLILSFCLNSFYWYAHRALVSEAVFPVVRWERRCCSNAFWSLPPAVAMAINHSLHCYPFPLTVWPVDGHPSSNQSQVALLQHPSQLHLCVPSVLLLLYISASVRFCHSLTKP